ncbi:MAG: T9SS type A sorting domain-containing protein [Methylococcales bacterium]
MTAAVPTAGTGVWSQVSGPVTTNIISPNLPNTTITGFNTLGTYTFRWTVSNSPCPSTFDEVDVVVNGNPASFTITGGGTFCPSGTTLAGPVNANYTYQWGKSYLTAPFTGVGTAQTLAVTSSGIYELVVTNQFGCSTSNTAVVNAADYVFNGSLAAGDATQTGRLNRFAAISTCAAPKACPNTFTTTGSRVYDSYTITNPRPVPVCAVIGLNSGCGTAIFSVAYSGSFDPNALCTNYLADPGSSPSTSIFYEATIPANGTIVVVVHEVNPGQGCANYSLTVDVPRDGAPIVVNPSSVTCAGTATLTAPVASSYSWTPSGATTRSITTPPLFVNTQYKVLLGYGNNGCTRLDSTTVTVTSLPPTISCPANITANNTPGICGRAVTYTETVGGLPAPTVTYAFTGATVASGSGSGSGSVFNVGVTTVTLTATNACGNVNCFFTVTIVDNQPPTVTVGTIGSCYQTVAAAQAAALAATSATDNCPGALTETASTVGTCSAVVTVRTTDAAGNFTDVTYNTRIDNTPPTITCPAPITVCGSAAVPVADITSVTATDNCPGVVTITFQGDAGTVSTTAPYNITRTYRATDGCGNFSECTQIITVNPIATVDVVSNQVLCNGAPTTAVNFISPTTGGTIVYNWTNTNTAIGLAASGTGNIASFTATNSTTAPISGTITVTPSYSNAGVTCVGTAITFTFTVNPTATITSVANQVVCNNSPTTAVTFTSPTSGGSIVYNWTNNTTSIGLAATGNGNIASFTAVNTGTAPVVATITVTPSYTNAGVTCVGTPITYTYTVNPTATVNAVANQVVCNNSPTTAVTFSSPTTGGTIVYNWTNNTTSIGLAASGTGNIASFTAVNTGAAPVTATITVIPSYTNAGVTCVGTARTYTYTVNPTATVNAVANQVVCNNSPTTAVAFSSPTTGGTIVYNWTNNTTSIGLAASGTGNIASFTAVNTGTAPIVATITVTPSYTNGGVTCVGTPITYTYTVNPTATVNTVTSQVICNGSPTTAVTFSSPTTGGTIVYNWTNNTTSIGLAATGSGNIASFTAVNTGTAPVIATITVTPSYTNGGVTCVGTPTTYTYTVNPTATVNVVANQVVCNLSPTTAVTFSSPTTGGTIVYNWTNTTTSIGLAASGTGNIASFTATNTTTAPVTATITVTPSYTNAGVTCVGTPRTFTITVNPTATVNPVANQVLCNNFPTTAVTFSSPTTGGTIVYNWTNSASSIGLASSGSGNIASFTATNTTQVPVVATITVTPSYTNGGVTCVGTPLTFTITVNPTPIVTLAPFAAICKNAAPITLTGGSPVAGPGTTGVYLVDNVAQTIFNPANYTPGLHTIVYIYTNQFGCVNRATQTILVHPIHTVEITVAPNSGVTPSAPLTVIATVSPVDNYSYVWRRNGTIVPGANGDRITVLANDAGNYIVTVTAPTGCVVVSSSAFTPSATIPQTLFIFPNPSTGIFNVSYNNGGSNLTARTLNVYDSKGAKVFSESYSLNVPFGNMKVDISKYAKGLYYVVLNDSNGKKLASAAVEKL